MVQVDRSPIVQRVLLGAALRAAREAIGMESAAATKKLGWYAGKLSKVEQGDLKLTATALDKMVDIYEIAPQRADELRQLAIDSRRKLPPTRVDEWAVKYVHLIAAAEELKIFNLESWPGTVQTLGYATGMLSRSVVVSPVDVERMSQERANRANRFTSPGARRLWLVVGEEALYREIGGRDVLRQQLEKILCLARLPNVTIQVIPYDEGAHPSHGVAFSIVTLLEGRPGIVYVEGLTASDYLGGEHLRVYNQVFDNLRAAALSGERTIGLIENRISEL
ncbi:hypothetical protein ALI144C_16415 [Actinosynnema sp. ALI-1.44]|uniref:helix-turn-helix domain-containing protein n=1 Tax=Actinosynnema sp. ALI-1.44 TaxID=1933779 RepID=UPI00097BD0B2|nr:helix-turn-helix transcriptional regulator [Actinosynnema sp. ALI-1.44]ONI84244.1 hypothetical protein ALI144C_16415 [Actinosynnema sp. ALI-1.44]